MGEMAFNVCHQKVASIKLFCLQHKAKLKMLAITA